MVPSVTEVDGCMSVNLTPPYKGWAAKLEAEKKKRSVLQTFTNAQLEAQGKSFEDLCAFAEFKGFTLTKTPTGAELRIKNAN